MNKPKTVTVQATQWHTYEGKEYDAGDQDEAPEELVDSLALQNKAMRVVSKSERSAAKKARKDAKGTKGAKGTYGRRDMRAKKQK